MDVLFPLAVFLMLGIAIIAVVVNSLPPGDREWMRRLLLASLSLRLVLATAFVLVPSLRVFHLDAAAYEWYGIALASVWRGEYPPFPVLETNSGFIYLCGALNYVFGRYQAVPSYFNCIVGTMLVFTIYRLANRFFHPAVGRLSAIMVGLMPSMVLWSSMALKDALVTLLLVITLSACVGLKEKISVKSILGAALPILPIQSLRFYMIYFVGFALVVSLVIDKGTRFLTGIYKQLFLGMVVIVLFTMLGLAERTEQDVSYFDLQTVSTYRRGMAITANSGFQQDADISTPAGALAFLPIGIAHLLWAPFPWQMVSLGPLLAAPETILWWFLFPATMRGVILAVRKRFSQTSALLIFSITLVCAYSLVHGNVGSAFRQRAQIQVFLFIFCAAGIYMKRLRRSGMNPDYVLATDGEPVPSLRVPG